MKRRHFLGLGAAGASAYLLAACSNDKGSGGEVASQVPSDLTATVTYAMWAEDQKATIQQMVAAFNKSYPNIKVNITVTPWENYFTKLQTQANGGQLPDVFWMNSGNFSLYASEKQLEPLGPLGIDSSVFVNGLNETYSYDGTIYGAPKDYDTIGLFYNKAILQRAGVPEPTADWTWDTYHENAKKISDKLKGEGIYGAGGGWANQELLYPLIYTYGGKVITDDKKSGYDSEAGKKALKLIHDMAADGSTPDEKFVAENWITEVFGAGKIGMMTGGNWNAGILKPMKAFGDIQVAPLPKGTQQATVIHGTGHVVSAKSKNKQAAGALVQFLAGKEAGEIQGKSGGAIPAYKGLEQGYVSQYPTLKIKEAFVDVAPSAQPMPASKNTAAWQKHESEFLPKIVSGELSVDDGAKALAEAINKDLAAEK